MLLGAHVGTAGGVKNAPVNGVKIGCDVMQIFSKNQRQWDAKPLDDENIAAFKAGVAEHGFGPTLVHCSYLLNLASPDDALWERSVAGLIVELERAEQLGIPFVVFHPGSPKEAGQKFGLERVAAGVTRALEATAGAKVVVLLENNAGAGACVGRSIDELQTILDGVTAHQDRVGVCVDTCHAFVSGYPIHTREGYDAYFDEFEAKIGLDRLKCFHFNDAKEPFGSNRDRHERFGDGLMGTEVFYWLMTDARFERTPAYIETPYDDDEDYAAQVTFLRELAAGKRAPVPAPQGGQMTLGGGPAPGAPPQGAKKATAKKATKRPAKKAAKKPAKKAAKKPGTKAADR